MSVAEMKVEAINKIANLKNEALLKEVLNLLDEEKKEASFNLSRNYEAIKEQYGDVLQKLAQ